MNLFAAFIQVDPVISKRIREITLMERIHL